jgi:hypothetical protein
MKLVLEPNLSESTFAKNIVLDCVVRLAETPSPIGHVYWRWTDEATMELEYFGRVAAGHSLRVPFEFKGRSIDLFLVSETSAGQRSVQRILEAVSTTFTPPARVYSGEAEAVIGEDLAAFDLVHLYNDGGTGKVRKADATDSTRPAVAFVREAATGDSLVSGDTARLFFGGNIITTTGRTPGAVQYLSETAGQMTETPPSGTGKVVQVIGRAISPTEVIFEPDEPFVLA